MFDLKRPCKNCPFKVGNGSKFRLRVDRLNDIKDAPAFQCHKTVDYSGDTPDQSDRPQQCAGLMSVLARQGWPNQIMQVAERLGALNPAKLDPDQECYHGWYAVLCAHVKGEEPDDKDGWRIHEDLLKTYRFGNRKIET